MAVFLWKDKNYKLGALMVYLGILSHITEEYPALFRKTSALFVKPSLQKALPQAIRWTMTRDQIVTIWALSVLSLQQGKGSMRGRYLRAGGREASRHHGGTCLLYSRAGPCRLSKWNH